METPEQTEQDLSAKISFLNARHTLEHLARSVEGGIERGEGGWETNADFCRLHPFAAMLKIATLLQSPNGVIDGEIDGFTLECAEHCDASLDELYLSRRPPWECLAQLRYWHPRAARPPPTCSTQ